MVAPRTPTHRRIVRVVARIYDQKRAEVYERLGIPTVATVPWTTGRLLKTLLGETTNRVWRDPSGAIVLLHVVPHEGWIGRTITDFETATSSHVGMLTRFGTGTLPTPGGLIQSGDTLHVLVTDAQAETIDRIAGTAPDGAPS